MELTETQEEETEIGEEIEIEEAAEKEGLESEKARLEIELEEIEAELREIEEDIGTTQKVPRNVKVYFKQKYSDEAADIWALGVTFV